MPFSVIPISSHLIPSPISIPSHLISRTGQHLAIVSHFSAYECLCLVEDDVEIFINQRGLHSIQRNILHIRNTFIISKSAEHLQNVLLTNPRTYWVDEDSFTFSSGLPRGWYFQQVLPNSFSLQRLVEYLCRTSLYLSTPANTDLCHRR